MRKTPLLAAALGLLAGPVVRADTVDVSSTTFVTAGQQTRNGAPGAKPELDTVVPAYELLNLTASDLTNPLVDDLRIVLSTWGAIDFADRRWDAGTDSDYTGDVVVGYVQGRVAQRHLQLRLGRQNVMTGVGRMLQLDGGEAIVFGPAGLQLSGYVGAPVSQRFSYLGSIRSWNPAGGDLAYGGRLGWSLAIPGIAGRGLDLGASANMVDDGGDPVRQEVGVDARFRPVAAVTVTGFGAYSVYDEKVSEAQVLAQLDATRKLNVTADWHFVAPGLLLARNSIFSVFSDSEWNSFGVGGDYELGHGLSVGADYHLAIEPEDDGDYYGNDAAAHVQWERGPTISGAEVSYLDASSNGWIGGRLYTKHTYGRIFAAADVLAHYFREQVNSEHLALTGALTGGVEIARGFSAVLSGRAGVTPFLEQTYDVMAKLVYNQTYRAREVR
jgi:hypothetical protein